MIKIIKKPTIQNFLFCIILKANTKKKRRSRCLTTSKPLTPFSSTTQVMYMSGHSMRPLSRLPISKMTLRQDSSSLDRFRRWSAHFILTSNGLSIDSGDRISGKIWKRLLMLATTTLISRFRFHTSSPERILQRRR